MDTLYFGDRGSGKTLGAVMEMYYDYLEGNELWSNVPLNPYLPHRYIESLELIKESFKENIPTDGRQRTCLIDETHTQADSRTSSAEHNRLLYNFVSQARKRNFRMLYTSQIMTGYDVRLRTLTHNVVICKPVIDYNDIGLGTVNYPEPLEFQYISRLPKQNWDIEASWSIPRSISRLFYDLYETDAVIMPIEMRIEEKLNGRKKK